MMRMLRSAGVFLLVYALAAPAVLADWVKLKDGTVLEGTVIPRGDGSYWVKTSDGTTRTVAASDVASNGKGAAAKPPAPAGPATPAAKAGAPGSTPAPTPPPAVAGATPAKPAGANLSFTGTKARANSVETALAAVTIWQQWVDNSPTSPDLPAAKEELAKWKGLADSGAEKINGKWIGGDERKQIVDKARALEKEARELMESKQSLQAVKKLEEAAKIYPNSFETNFNLAYLYMIEHNEAKAQLWFDQVLRVQPDCPEAVANLGVLALVKKQPQYEKGVSLLRKSLEHGDRKEIVQNLLTAVAYCPPQMQKNNAVVKEATEAARLLASRYGIPGPQQAFYIIPLRDPEKLAKAGGKHNPADKGKGGDDDDDLHGATGMWSGSGFIISDDGLILTNRHVVDGGKTLLVLLSDKTQKSAEVVVIDDTQDLALIRIKADAKLPFVKLAAVDSPADGAECTVMGYPLLDRLGAAIKVTRGIVSSGASGGKSLVGPDVIFDAKVNPGNSGGPILDRHGNVMAIVSMKTIASALEDTYGLGISAGHIRKFLDKNKVKFETGKDDGASLSAEEIAAKVKPAAVCILATK